MANLLKGRDAKLQGLRKDYLWPPAAEGGSFLLPSTTDRNDFILV